jgi:hypothetical protein
MREFLSVGSALAFMTSQALATCPYPTHARVTATSDYQQIHDMTITVTGTNSCIDTGGFTGVSIYSIKCVHAAGYGIYVHGGSGVQINAVNVKGSDDATSLDNIKCYSSSGLVVDNVRGRHGNETIRLTSCNGSRLSHIEGGDQHDIGGSNSYGGLVQWIDSDDGKLLGFSNTHADAVLTAGVCGSGCTGGDGVNAFQSSNIEVGNNTDGTVGTIDGVYGIYASAVQDDAGTSNMWVHDTYVRNFLDSAFAAYGQGGDSATFSSDYAKTNVISSHQGNSSANQSIFYLGDCSLESCATPKTNVVVDVGNWTGGVGGNGNFCPTCGFVPSHGGFVAPPVSPPGLTNNAFTFPTVFVANVCP